MSAIIPSQYSTYIDFIFKKCYYSDMKEGFESVDNSFLDRRRKKLAEEALSGEIEAPSAPIVGTDANPIILRMLQKINEVGSQELGAINFVLERVETLRLSGESEEAVRHTLNTVLSQHPVLLRELHMIGDLPEPADRANNPYGL